MYHYVQSFDKKKKYFSFLDVKNFIKQLNFFKKKYQFFDCSELFSKKIKLINKIFLTFDDGLACHYDYVYKILKREKINAIFYIPTLPLEKQKILDVHKIHLILGTVGPKLAVQKLYEILSKNKNLIDERLLEKYKKKIYLEGNREKYSNIFKGHLNYFIKKEYKKIIINRIFKSIFDNDEKKIVKNFYLKEGQIKEMSNNNMVIGSHSVSHNLLPEIKMKTWKKEIDNSFDYLSQFYKNKTFSYPYGGYQSFNHKIKKYLKKSKVSFSVNVESRNIIKKDIVEHRQTLPRYDCNEFPYGKIKNYNDKGNFF